MCREELGEEIPEDSSQTDLTTPTKDEGGEDGVVSLQGVEVTMDPEVAGPSSSDMAEPDAGPSDTEMSWSPKGRHISGTDRHK